MHVNGQGRFCHVVRWLFQSKVLRMHPSCTHKTVQELHTLAGDIELYGVPGPVRTANLPLRRGMLYPIELLGQMLTRKG